MSHIVYRIIRNDEDVSYGLQAKGAGKNVAVEAHVRHGGISSPWISVTCSPAAAVKYDMKERGGSEGIRRIVAVDLDEIDTSVEDCRDQTGWGNVLAYNILKT